VQKVVNLTDAEVIAAGRKYVTRLVDPDVCKVSIVCHQSKVQEFVQGFSE